MNKSVTLYLASIGKKGGLVKSPAKSAAARANGLKGGRPKKDRGAIEGNPVFSGGRGKGSESAPSLSGVALGRKKLSCKKKMS